MVVLDTHVWIWWMSDSSRLSQPAADAIESVSTLGVSAASSWEVSLLAKRGKLKLELSVSEWIEAALRHPGIAALPIDSNVAVNSAQLESPFPQDPADRLIYATARLYGATLITRDRAIRDYDPRGTLW